MYTLAFDTSARCCSIGLMNNNHLVDSFAEEMDFGQAEVLLPQIETMLKRNSLKFADINLLGVCIGPGSFTGVRSAISCARAFSLALPELSVTGISAFDAYVNSLAELLNISQPTASNKLNNKNIF